MADIKDLCSSDVSVIFPEDVLFDILSWLPVSSLLRFKSVCKSWYAFIQSPPFIHQHLHHTQPMLDKNNDHNILVLESDEGYHSRRRIYQIPAHNIHLHKQVEVPFFLRGEIEVYGLVTCNGLVCIEYQQEPTELTNLLFWNPAIKQFRAVQDPCPCFASVGFGFNLVTKDYNVVLVDLNENESSEVYIYSLVADSWTSKQLVLPDNVLGPSCDPGTPVRSGSYSWMVYRRDFNKRHYYVLTFDFGKETFETTPLPDTFNRVGRICVLKGCFSCINILESQEEATKSYEIWVLKEDGDRDSWTKLFTVELFLDGSSPFPRALLKNGEYMVWSSNHEMVVYNIVTKEIQLSIPLEFKGASSALYKESLVSIKGAISY